MGHVFSTCFRSKRESTPSYFGEKTDAMKDVQLVVDQITGVNELNDELRKKVIEPLKTRLQGAQNASRAILPEDRKLTYEHVYNTWHRDMTDAADLKVRHTILIDVLNERSRVRDIFVAAEGHNSPQAMQEISAQKQPQVSPPVYYQPQPQVIVVDQPTHHFSPPPGDRSAFIRGAIVGSVIRGSRMQRRRR